MKKLSVVVIALAFGVVFWSSESLGAAASGSTQTVSGGGVAAKVTYLNPNSRNDLRFQVSLETHSVLLDGYDLKSLALLRDDKGMSYPPTAVENKGGGHHREIILTFSKVSSDAKTFKVVIKDVAGVKERVFSWSVE